METVTDRSTYNHEYYLKNRERLLIVHNKYNLEHKKPKQPRKTRVKKYTIDKPCPHCGVTKSIEDFRLKNGKYHSWICKECEIKYTVEYAKNNKESANNRRAKWAKANRDKINKWQNERYYQKKIAKSLESQT